MRPVQLAADWRPAKVSSTAGRWIGARYAMVRLSDSKQMSKT
jgi:hypothetical protein